MENFNYWEFLAGLGIFLLGMSQMEGGIQVLAGKSFRQLLQKFTNKPWKGIVVGTGITALLQSSSLVTLLVLAFLGAGVLSLHHALGVILGANLGTTLTGWIVATVGFKLSIEAMAFPFIGLGSLLFIFFSPRPLVKNTGLLILGLGFLFLGIEWMKGSIETIADQVDLAQLSSIGTFAFLLFGLIITALIQSSSATLVILLTALHAQVIGLEQAAAATIGANIGTTLTVILGALTGTPDKKRLALVHTLFNVISGLLVFIVLDQIIDGILSQSIAKDPMISLVLFNTLLNLFGILLFYPFLSLLESWVQRRFQEQKHYATRYIQNVDIAVPEAAIRALENELDQVYEKTKLYIQLSLGLTNEPQNQGFWEKVLEKPFEKISLYNQLKEIEDEMIAYHIKLHSSTLSEPVAKQLTAIMLSLRLMIFAAKDFKDINHNLIELQNATRNLPKNFLKKVQQKTQDTLQKIEDITNPPRVILKIPDWLEALESESDTLIEEFYQEAKKHKTDIPFSTLTNVTKEFSRGLYHLGAAILHKQHPINEVLDDQQLPHYSKPI
ncbi:Na/Pi symporter [Algoriphagus sp.]|uniref:Na/Pi cotransporter family protein n=1 Tax=Algoriphagus sp. TaxID=1872435 RepID=UPI0026226770|nr:Na/Pi symporter [Algoriphagus sp.]